MPSEPHKLIMQYAMDWFTACKPMLNSPKKCVVQVHWHAPLPGIFKLNTDGSRKSDSGAIGAGGLIRNSAGDWITGFAVNQGVGSSLEAELWGIFWGLHLAWDNGCSYVEVECDASSVVSLLAGPIASTHPLFSLINCCKLKMQQDWFCSLTHVFREQNSVADVLAHMSHDLAPGFHRFDLVPPCVCISLVADVCSLARPRVVVV
ncbi:hypothetical protein CerSpe_167670 [Prunus speciosa]